jgi:hypothetical protein
MANTTSVADYQVLLDQNVTLDTAFGQPEDPEITLNFSVPSDLINSGFSRQPVLAFKARPFEDSSFTIFMNHREIFSTSLDASHTRIFWEVFSFQTAFPDGASFSNPTPVRFLLNSGRLRIADMVLWYQVDRPWE